jgi:Xaa-Pro aminopeptidase
MIRRRSAAVVLACVVTAGSFAFAQIGEQEYANRRQGVLAQVDSLGAVVFRSADTKTRSGDVAYQYRQESNLLYLTGMNSPEVSLILAPAGLRVGERTGRVALFVADDQLATTEIPDGIVAAKGQFEAALESVAVNVKTLYVSAPDLRFVYDWLNHKSMFLERDSRKEMEKRIQGLKTKPAGSLVSRLRSIKTQAEVELIGAAIRMTGEGLRRAMKTCRPGVREYELQAAIELEMTRGGSRFPGFPAIVGSGPNSLIPHYDDNTREMRKGEVVVMDVGAEYAGYSADITRTIPVSGEFSEEQMRVYTTVLQAQKEVIALIKAGLPWGELDKRGKEVVTAAGFGRFWTHPVSHHLGIDVHDAGPMDTLRAGMVITVEPGIYVPANDTTVVEGLRGFGVRIEDDVLVEKSGARVLSGAIPKDPAEIISAMRAD